MAKKQQKSKQKLTQKQKQERIRVAEERAKREEAAKAAKERTKRIFTIVVCVILALALGIPTIGLAVLSGGA